MTAWALALAIIAVIIYSWKVIATIGLIGLGALFVLWFISL